MSPEEASAVVGSGKRVRMNYATGAGHHGEGIAYGYSLVPVLMIELPDGTRTTWRHDLCEVIEEDS